MIGAFWEMFVTREVCMFIMIGYLMSLVVVAAIMISEKFGMGVLVFVPYAIIGLPIEYYMEWILNPVLISPFAAVLWSLVGPAVGLVTDLVYRFLPKSIPSCKKGILLGLALVTAHFLVMLGALSFLYIDPIPNLEHYLNDLGFTLPWLLINGVFGGYTAYALSRDLIEKE